MVMKKFLDVFFIKKRFYFLSFVKFASFLVQGFVIREFAIKIALQMLIIYRQRITNPPRPDK